MLTRDNPRLCVTAGFPRAGNPCESVVSQIAAVGKDAGMLQGKAICHLSSAQQTLDYRAFYMECVPLAERGLRMQLIASHGITGHTKGVELVSFATPRNRILRMLFASRILSLAVGKRADVYKVHVRRA